MAEIFKYNKIKIKWQYAAALEIFEEIESKLKQHFEYFAVLDVN